MRIIFCRFFPPKGYLAKRLFGIWFVRKGVKTKEEVRRAIEREEGFEGNRKPDPQTQETKTPADYKARNQDRTTKEANIRQRPVASKVKGEKKLYLSAEVETLQVMLERNLNDEGFGFNGEEEYIESLCWDYGELGALRVVNRLYFNMGYGTEDAGVCRFYTHCASLFHNHELASYFMAWGVYNLLLYSNPSDTRDRMLVLDVFEQWKTIDCYEYLSSYDADYAFATACINEAEKERVKRLQGELKEMYGDCLILNTENKD